MSALTEKIKNIDGLEYTGGCTYSQINEAEAKLDMKFPDELKEYLLEFGAISFGSTELTGLNVEEQLNIVETTLHSREQYDKFPVKHAILKTDMLETVVINEQGYIYTFHNMSLYFICDSISEFLDKRICEGFYPVDEMEYDFYACFDYNPDDPEDFDPELEVEIEEYACEEWNPEGELIDDYDELENKKITEETVCKMYGVNESDKD